MLRPAFPQPVRRWSLRSAVLAGLCSAAISGAVLVPVGAHALASTVLAAPAVVSAAGRSAIGAGPLTPRLSILTVYLVDSPEQAAALRQYLARPPQERNPTAVLLDEPSDAASTAQSLAAFRLERGEANVHVIDLRRAGA